MIALPLLLATQLTLWHSYRGDEQRGLELAIAEWNAAHPDAIVEPVAIPNEGFTQKLQAAIPHGHGPDAFIASHELVGEWAQLGLITPMHAADDAQPGRFVAGAEQALERDGKAWGLPLAFKALALFYRTDRIAVPPASTDELRTLCRLQRAGDGRVCLAYEAGSFYYHAAWLHGFGGSVFPGERQARRDSQTAPKLATPEGIAALAFVRALVEEHVIPDETTGAAVTELFNNGRAAMVLNGPWFLGEIKPGTPFKVAPLPLVSATGRPASPFLTVEAGILSARAAHPEAARRFLEWLATDGAEVRLRVGHQPVALRAAWAKPDLDPALLAFARQVDAAGGEGAVPMSTAPEMRAVWEPAQLALRRVLRGAADPAAALTEADRLIAVALRPAPAPAGPAPYLLGFGLVLLGGGALALRRGRSALAATRRGDGWAWAWLAPAATAMGVLVFVPFAVGAAMSLYHFDGATWRFIGLANFADLLGSRDQPITSPMSFYFTLVVTALWTVCNVALHVVFGVALALALRDPDMRARGLFRVALIIPWAVPNYITALIWKGMFHRQLGAVNALLAALGVEPVSWFAHFWTAFTANVVTNVWMGFPFMMVTTLGCLSRIPKELEEAAALDSASRWQRFTHLILPLLRPALLPSVVLGAVWTFNMFNVVFLVSGGEPDGATDILISQAYRWAFTRGHQYGYAAAYAVLIFAVLVAQSIAARRLSPTEDAS